MLNKKVYRDFRAYIAKKAVPLYPNFEIIGRIPLKKESP